LEKRALKAEPSSKIDARSAPAPDPEGTPVAAPIAVSPIRDGMRRPVPQGRGCFRIPIDALDEVQKETGL